MLVKIYRNLHNGMYSIVAKTGIHKNRVIGYASRVLMDDVNFSVSDAGRQRVISERRKNVHAYVIGTLRNALDYQVRLDNIPMEMQQPFNHDCYVHVRYNPYESGSFVGKTVSGSHIDISGADQIYLHHDGMLASKVTL